MAVYPESWKSVGTNAADVFGEHGADKPSRHVVVEVIDQVIGL